MDPEQEPHAAALEEGHLRHLKEERQAEQVAVERHGAIHIMHDDRDLLDLRQLDRCTCVSRITRPPSPVPIFLNAPKGNRTPVPTLKEWCPSR